MFSQLLAWLHLLPLQTSVEKGTDTIPNKLLQIQRKDLHTFDNDILDIWHVRENDIVACVPGGVEIKGSVLLLESVSDLVDPLEKQPHDV